MTRWVAERVATVRITGGEARGRRVSAPDGLEVRPTGAKVRQAFFNILGPQLKNCRFLDLFAGSGLMGIEALSRGAGFLISVEEQQKMIRIIHSNLVSLDFDAEVICGDVRKVLPTLQGQKFDVIFADPPYKAELGNAVIEIVDKHQLLSDEGVLAIEHLRNLPVHSQFGSLAVSDVRLYGQTAITFFRILQEPNRTDAHIDSPQSH